MSRLYKVWKKKKNEIEEYHLNRNQPVKPQFAVYDLNEYLKKHKGDTNRPHIHSYYQIIWFKSGEGKHFVDFKEYEVRESSIFFIAKNQVHYFNGGKEYRGVLLHFNDTFLIQKDNEVEFFLKYNLFNNPYQQPSCCVGSRIDLLLDQYLDMIKTELQNDNTFGGEELLRAYLKAFLK